MFLNEGRNYLPLCFKNTYFLLQSPSGPLKYAFTAQLSGKCFPAFSSIYFKSKGTTKI